MFCPNCGSALENDSRFCSNCGNAVDGGNVSQVSATPAFSTPVVSPTPSPVQPVVAPPKKKKSILPIILVIVIAFLILFIGGIILVVALLVRSVDSSDKLVCTSSKGDITISYKDDEITGYYANGITYDLDQQKEYAKLVGMDQYIKEFNEWFESNTGGSCTVQNSDYGVTSPIHDWDDDEDDDDDTKIPVTPSNSLKTVGGDIFGYVDVPSNWVVFVDTDGSDSLQYSYGTKYIVTLDYVENPPMSAKDAAARFVTNQQADSQVTNVKSSTVTIGKTKKYTAYQVSMYYPNEKETLYTYWFEVGDGNLHYLALEGPDGVDEYLPIIESFSMTK